MKKIQVQSFKERIVTLENKTIEVDIKIEGNLVSVIYGNHKFHVWGETLNKALQGFKKFLADRESEETISAVKDNKKKRKGFKIKEED